METNNENKILIERPIYNNKQIRNVFPISQSKTNNNQNLTKLKKHLYNKLKPNKEKFINFLKKRFPISEWLLVYNVRENILKDLIAGITAGIIQIAPTMANSTMANLPSINGLYLTFFVTMVYFFMGTCKQISLGTHGVVALMIGKTIRKYSGILYPENQVFIPFNETDSKNSTGYLSMNIIEAKLMIATSLAFFTGLIQIIFSIINGGIVTRYLSKNILNSFTVASAIVIIVSQIDSLLGITIKDEHIPFELANNLIGIAKQIHTTNFATLIISIVSITALFIVKHFNDKYKEKLPTPIPIELIVIVVATLLSHFLEFNQIYDVEIVDDIPLGFPAPKFPPIFKLFSTLILESLNIAIVAYAINISLVKYFSNKYNYDVEPNQELLSYGIGNLASSFFAGFPACCSLSRSLVIDTIGAKSQIFSFLASIIALITFVGIGFLFESLPRACLSSIIVASLAHKALEVKTIIPIIKKSKLEAISWGATFLGVVILDIDYGLYIGLGVSLLIVIIQTQIPEVSILGNLSNTELYENVKLCSSTKEFNHIKIIRYEANLFYLNVDNFVYKVYKLSTVNPKEYISKIDKINEKLKEKSTKINDIELANNKCNQVDSILDEIKVKNIILDMSCVNYIDSMGIDTILTLKNQYEKLKLKLLITHLKGQLLDKMNMFSFSKNFDAENIFATNYDAVCYLKNIK